MGVHADVLIRAKLHTLQDSVPVQHALAVQDERILAISESSHGLDHLIGPNTLLIEEPNATALPAFDDTHSHLIFAGLSNFDVPVHTARSLPDMLELIRQAASKAELGEWVTTTANWQEYNLEGEKRLPNVQELDAISTQNPIVVMRGGHNMAVNSLALQMAAIKDQDGQLNGLLQDSAVSLIHRCKPSADLAQRIAGLSAASQAYAATGIGCVRDCCVSVSDLRALKATHDAGKLHVRVRALMSAIGLSTAAELEALLDEMEPWRYLQDEPWLSIWGVKFMLDRGIEAAATEEPYVASECHCATASPFRGRVLWNPDDLLDAMDAVIRRGWRIGTHAYGDRAVGVLLDVYARLLERHPNLPVGTIVMEHGGMATAAQRSRAVELGVPVTVQHPLLYEAAGIQEYYLGRDRVSRMFPVREWVDLGALVTGGSDYPVGAFGAMHSVWGMWSRQTVVGVRGEQHAISVAEAISLHITAAVKMLRETDSRGALVPGLFADITIWTKDPLDSTHISDMRNAKTLYTIVGGKIRYHRT